MGSSEILLDSPAIPRVLELLMETKEGCDEMSVMKLLPDKAYAQKALQVLLGQGIIEKEDGRLRIAEGEEISRTIKGIIRFYARIDRITRRRLLFRGILNTTHYECLVHFNTFIGLMQNEGFAQPEVEVLLEKDRREGYVERVKIMYRSREGVRHRCFPFIPLYYYPHFIMMKSDQTEHLRERLKNAGVCMTEEEYLLGHYPKEIASQSRDYITREKEHIRQKIKNEAFDIWWYYRY
ncbi:MAG: hypothetical protein A4E57_02661 [Syntrophorhabdaceae bacterium PtaU1.Bin034]|nr:MAG: hypothetical protein A4E57_02661 [Syntrophorhabdaceae bacterium PtaU1.Bin034]